MQEVELEHETPLRKLNLILGFGLGMIDHFLPFQDSTSVPTLLGALL
jgi:hypothetical protein